MPGTATMTRGERNVALKLFHNPLRNQLHWVGQFCAFLQILKTFKRFVLTLIDDLPHVFFAYAWNKLQRVHPRSNGACGIEEVDKPFFPIRHYFAYDAWKLSFGRSS